MGRPVRATHVVASTNDDELTHADVGSVGELKSEVVGLDQVQMVENLLVEQRTQRSLLYMTPAYSIYLYP